MLYVTTRINTDAFTPYRALTQDRGPEGGLYLPMRMPIFSDAQIASLKEKSFSENVADVMNRLFGTKLTGWAVEFAIGRYPVRLVELSSKVVVGESWHNPDWKFERLAKNLARFLADIGDDPVVTDWMRIAARIGILFGIYAELQRSGSDGPMDVAVPSGDFSAPMAAWYARSWGLPIGNVVICCNENNSIWNLLHQGELRTDAVALLTSLPDCDHAVPKDLERLIYSTLGPGENLRYREACRTGRTYYLQEYPLSRLREGMCASVVSTPRTESKILNIYKDNGYIPDPYTALCYSGLLDYRSQTGEGRTALILSEESPAFSLDMICRCLGLSRRELKNRIDKG